MMLIKTFIMNSINLKLLLLGCYLYFGINYVQSQSSTIIGFDVNNINLEDTSYIVAFDYLAETHDTLATFTPEIHICNSCTAFDHFRKKFYYFTCYGGCGGPAYMKFKTIDLLTLTRETLFTTEEYLSIIGLEYEFFSNSLIIRIPDSILIYDLSSSQFSDYFAIPQSKPSTFGSFPYAYNIYSQQYLYIAWLTADDEFHFISSDINNHSYTIFPFPEEQNPHMVVADIFSNQFWGTYRDSINNDFIVRIDPDNGHITHVCPRPNDYHSHYNFQKAVFDPYRNLYLLPYSTEFSQNRLAKIDVSTGESTIIDFIPRLDYGFLNYDIQPILHYTDNNLIASVSDLYTWYLNDTMINGVDTRTLIPSAKGFYKFSTFDYRDSIVFSNEIFVEDINSIYSNTSSENELKVFPNPASSLIFVETNEFSDSYSEYNIYNTLGTIVKTGKLASGTRNKITISALEPGFYIISILTSEGSFTAKFIKAYE